MLEMSSTGENFGDIPRSVIEPTEGSRKNLILKLPCCWTIAWAEILQELQAKHDDTEMDLPSQGMALGLCEGHDRATDQTTE